MRNARFLEVLAGAAALLCGNATAFVLSGGGHSGTEVLIFSVISAMLLLLALCVLLMRISAYQRKAAVQLYRQLPSELRCRIRCDSRSKLHLEHLGYLMSQHLRAQKALLNQHYQVLFSNQSHYLPPTADHPANESEHTWRELRSELTTLEDQFATDMQVKLRNDPSADGNS